MDLRTANVTRYILPLREGGSLPALAEADDEFKYVVKFRGAGHGTKALIAELIGGEIARALGFRVPEIVFLNLDEAFGRTEADEEIQDLLQWSRGLNMGLHFLSGSLTFDPIVHQVDGKTASQVVWLDALLTNVDRTIKNTNMLIWHKELWLIDHGASLYFHHSWTNWQKQALVPFVQIKDHVLLPFADKLEEVDIEFRQILTSDKIREIVNAISVELKLITGEEANIIGIKMPKMLLQHISYSDNKPYMSNEMPKNCVYDSAESFGYALAKEERVNYKDFMSEKQFKVMVYNKCRERLIEYKKIQDKYNQLGINVTLFKKNIELINNVLLRIKGGTQNA